MSNKPESRTNLRVQNMIMSLLLVALLALGAFASQRYSVQWDMTANKRHSLAEQSIKAIQSFESGLTATVYVREKGDLKSSIKTLLERYQQFNADLAIRFVDPELDPTSAREQEITSFGTIVLGADARSEKITESSEEAITNGLIRLSKGSSKTIRFITGHGERSMDGKGRSSLSGAISFLKGEGYQTDKINLSAVETIPDQTAALILAGPAKPLLPIEVERLSTWLDKGGRLMVLNDPERDTGLEQTLEKWGIRFMDGVVIDPVSRLFGGTPTTPLIMQYDSGHAITKNLNAATFLPDARGLELSDHTAETGGQKPTGILVGAANGWAELGSLSSGSVKFDEGEDQKGPITLGATYQQNNMRLVVVGDSDFATNGYLNFTGNTDLFLNMVRWLAEDEDFIAIKPKSITDAGLTLTASDGAMLFWILVLIIPASILGLGLGIWIRRKRQ
ncbi:MAG: GldG family protein [Magnetococcales bacterium]|nr:GldG family protein [Magnetococcales bacterium]